MPKFARVRVEVLTSTGRLKELFIVSSKVTIRIVHVFEIVLSVCLTTVATLLNTVAYVPILNIVVVSFTVIMWLWTIRDIVVDNATRGLLDLKSLLEILLKNLKKTKDRTAQLYKTYKVGPVIFTVAIPLDMLRTYGERRK